MNAPESATELLTRQFYDWEQRGRGWRVWSDPVALEPPFRPFVGHFLPLRAGVDDGQFETPLSRLANRFLGRKPVPPVIPQVEEEPEPELTGDRERLIELRTYLPTSLKVERDEFEQFLFSVSLCRDPLAFELLGTAAHISAQFVVHPGDESLVTQQLQVFFPDAVFLPRSRALETAWEEAPESEAVIVEFGLSNEFMLPLASASIDPFVGITGGLVDLRTDEIGLFQVIFAPIRKPWAESIMRAATDGDAGPFFSNAPEVLSQAKEKVSRPLYAVVVRIATKSPSSERAWEIARNLASPLGVFSKPGGNELMPLNNEDYPYALHQEDLLHRQCRRSGMLLNSDELIGFVHLPSVEIRAPKFARQTQKTKLAPNIVRDRSGLVLGQNIHAGAQTPVVLTPEQRVRHVHIIGASGTGKSTLLYNLILQDIERGEGIAVLDPHGDLVDRILGAIPEKRIADVVLVDPSDEDYSVGFNILSAHSDLEKNLLASDLVSVFQRLSGSWGDQMASVLNNAILAFLESTQGGTLADLRRFLLEPVFRGKFLETVRDPDVVYYWQKGFMHLAGNKSIGPVLTRLETFLSRKPIRYMVSQQENRLDFSQILDTGKVFLAKLAQGIIGRENSYLLGTLLVSKLQQLAMSRQRQAESARRDFWIYIDEFHNFITPSMAEILSGARKYRIGLLLAHQELRQLQRDSEVASAVLQNSGTRVCFKVGDDDARKLADGFSSFEARDLQNLSTGEAICRVERSDFDFNLLVPRPSEPTESEGRQRSLEVITASRRKYGRRISELHTSIYIDLPTEEFKPPGPTPPPAPAQKATPPAPPQRPEPAPSPPPPQAQAPTASSTPASSPKPLGRGGPEHVYLQHLIKQLAIGMNFEVDVEKTILEGAGSADVALKKGDKRFAFEISITTDIRDELEHARKCFKAKFDVIVMVGLDAARLAKAREAALKEFTPSEQASLRFCVRDEISSVLLELSAMSASKDVVSHGKKTKVTFRPLSEEESRKRREILAQVSTQSLKKLRKDS